MDYIGSIISAVAVILVALIEMKSVRDRKAIVAVNRRTEESIAKRAKESLLAMELMDAGISLSVATAITVTEGRTYGEMKSAMEKAQTAQEAYNKFIHETAAEQYVKY